MSQIRVFLPSFLVEVILPTPHPTSPRSFVTFSYLILSSHSLIISFLIFHDIKNNKEDLYSAIDPDLLLYS